jgi:ring-1,2-phenylacetyl-CoA epoxidase subunit PaaD
MAVARARRVAAEVTDPELPMLTLADLGVLRDVTIDADGVVNASLTPTYSGCPAMAEMRADLDARLRAAGFAEVRIRTVLDPPWTTDWITPEGRRKLAEHGIAPPGATHSGVVPLTAMSSGTAGSDMPTSDIVGSGAIESGTVGSGSVRRRTGAVPLQLSPIRRAIRCPRCESADTEQISRFGATSCKSLWRCRGCLEPFEHLKEI